MRLVSAAICGIALAVAALAPAKAATFTREDFSNGMTGIGISGEIVVGDYNRLLAEAVAAKRRGRQYIAVYLNSPGGNILEAMKMAAGIHEVKFDTVVPDNAECASACFFLFAAGGRKFASPSAHIGVHSASIEGQENIITMGVSAMVSRFLTEWGVPAGIIVKMITTQPGDVAWLTYADTAPMGVRTLGGAGS
jgi:hypothetical protein